MNPLAHPALLAALFAGVTGLLALLVTAGAFAAEEATVAATPFQAIAPGLPPRAAPVDPSAAARVPYEAELIEADPERKNRWPTDQVDRLEDFTRLDLTRTDRPTDGVPRLEPSVGLIRPERVETPARTEKLDRPPEKLERPAKVERLEKVERVEKLERPEKIEKIERRERRERVERLDRSGRR